MPKRKFARRSTRGAFAAIARAAKKQRKYASRGRSRSMRYSSMRRNVHLYRRHAPAVEHTFTVDTGAAQSFQIGDLANSSEFTQLYDQYKITRVVLRFQLVNVPDSGLVYAPGTNTGTYQSTNFYPKLWYYADYDDTTPPTTTNIREVGKARCRVLRPNSMVTVSVKPAILNQLYRTPTTTAYSPVWNQRIDCSQGDVPHYGLKYAFDLNGVSSTTAFKVRVERTYYLTMYNTR